MRIILFFLFLTNAYATSPHIDESIGDESILAVRTLSSLSEGCNKLSVYDCVEYVDQLSPSVVRLSVKSKIMLKPIYLDIKLRGSCLNISDIVGKSSELALKNVQLASGFSSGADLYVDGKNLINECNQRRPSSHTK